MFSQRFPRRARAAVLLAAWLPLPLIHAAPTSLTSRVVEATVFPDRALVHRIAETTVGPGIQEILVTGLPAGLDEQSLQVSGSGPGGILLLDANLRNVFLDTDSSGSVRELREEIGSVEQSIRALDDQIESLNAQLQFVRKLAPPSLTPVAGTSGVAEVGADDLRELVDFLAATHERILPAIALGQRERAALNDKLSALRARLEELVNGDQRRLRTLLVRLQAKEAASVRLRISYLQFGASWEPSYQIRADTSADQLQIAYDARVRQTTGEPWRDVQLTLSTARPSLGAAAPEPGSWVLDVLRAMPATAMTMESGLQTRALAKGKLNEALADFEAPPTLVQSGATSASFRITTPVSIPEDGSPQKVSIGSFNLPARFEHKTTPKQIPVAYLSAHATNASSLPILPGPLSVFLDGSFVASSHIGSVMPGAEFEIALGADESVSVERKLLNRFTETVGLSQRTVRVTYSYETTLRNNHKEAVSLLLQDLVPVSRDERIVVRLVEPADRDKSVQRGADGVLTWPLNLAPGQEQKVTLKISVEHPADLPVSGLE